MLKIYSDTKSSEFFCFCLNLITLNDIWNYLSHIVCFAPKLCIFTCEHISCESFQAYVIIVINFNLKGWKLKLVDGKCNY